MVHFNNYKFADMTQEEKSMLSEMENKISSKDNKKVILIAYEEVDKTEK